jgi:prepilin peptidase CpaA
MYPWIVDGVLLLALTTALVVDLRERRIPVWITAPTAAIGLLLSACWWGLGADWTLPGFRSSFLGGFGAFLCFEIFYRLGWMGGGDSRLLGAIGTLVGYPSMILVVCCVAVIGGVQGVLALLAQTKQGRALCRRLGMKGTEKPEFAKTVPYGVAIVIGTIVFRVWQHVTAWQALHG